MDQQRGIRVSDGERQVAADRLRAALDEGRLDLFEYDDRLSQAYSSQTYADLDRLFVDLPVRRAPAAPVSPAPVAAAPGPARPPAVGLPTPLKVLWTLWSVVFAINMTVWFLVSLGNGNPEYFWPMWLFVPGVALTAVTVGVMSLRRDRAARRSRHPATVVAARRNR